MSEEKDMGQMASEAEAAQNMLDSEVFNQCFRLMNAQVMEQILATPPEAAEERERLYNMYKAGQMFVQQFAGLINNFELAKQQEEV